MGIPWWSSGWDTIRPLQGKQVPSLVRELKCHMPHDVKEKKKKDCVRLAWQKIFWWTEQSRGSPTRLGHTHTHVWKVKALFPQLCLALLPSMDYSQPSFSVHGIFQGKNTGVGSHSLLQGIFWTQGSNPGFLHCRQILYHLSHQWSTYVYLWSIRED